MASTLEIMNAARIAFWGNKPSAFIYQQTGQSVANISYTAINFDTVGHDNWGGWSSGSPSRYTVQVAGIYRLSGIIFWGANGTGQRVSRLLYNGNQINGSQAEVSVVAGYGQSCMTPVIEQACAVGDYLQLAGYQSSGGALSTNNSAPAFSSMTVEFVSFT